MSEGKIKSVKCQECCNLNSCDSAFKDLPIHYCMSFKPIEKDEISLLKKKVSDLERDILNKEIENKNLKGEVEFLVKKVKRLQDIYHHTRVDFFAAHIVGGLAANPNPDYNLSDAQIVEFAERVIHEIDKEKEVKCQKKRSFQK